MTITSAIKKTLLAISAAATLFVALPSQASDHHYAPQYNERGQGDYRHDRWDDRREGRDHDRHFDRWDRRDHGWHDRYAYDHHRADWRDHRYDDRRWR